MNEEIISTLLYSIVIIIFLTTFFKTISRNVELNNAYFRHAKALQSVNAIINHGTSYDEYCDYILTNSVNGFVRRGNETCQTYSTNPLLEMEQELSVSLPVIDNNKVVWVGSYA